MRGSESRLDVHAFDVCKKICNEGIDVCGAHISGNTCRICNLSCSGSGEHVEHSIELSTILLCLSCGECRGIGLRYPVRICYHSLSISCGNRKLIAEILICLRHSI